MTHLTSDFMFSHHVLSKRLLVCFRTLNFGHIGHIGTHVGLTINTHNVKRRIDRNNIPLVYMATNIPIRPMKHRTAFQIFCSSMATRI